MIGVKQVAFQIENQDHVATALTDINPGPVTIRGNTRTPELLATSMVPKGHKVAVVAILKGEPVLKYGIKIGYATMSVQAGDWVHLHNMRSAFDERSSHLDAITGAPTDTEYR